ncbi:MAG: PBSX family phage terminase large subunit, partial [Pseudoclavibacter sp.]
FVKQLLARMSPPGAKLIGTTNPDGPRHWLKTEYLDRIDRGELPDWRRFHFTMDDNPSLTADYIASLKREYTGLWYRRFILGEWVAAEGAIYSDFTDQRHVIPWRDMPPLDRIVGVGIDHGTSNPTAAILLGITREPRPRLIAIDEWAHQPERDGGQLADIEQSRRFRAWLAQPHTPHGDGLVNVRTVYADPAAASLRKQLRDDNVPTRAARNEVIDGIRTVASLLATDQLVITDRCRLLLDELPGYVWDEKATEDGHDAPVKHNDHAVDALRYIVHSAAYSWRKHLR